LLKILDYQHQSIIFLSAYCFALWFWFTIFLAIWSAWFLLSFLWMWVCFATLWIWIFTSLRTWLFLWFLWRLTIILTWLLVTFMAILIKRLLKTISNFFAIFINPIQYIFYWIFFAWFTIFLCWFLCFAFSCFWMFCWFLWFTISCFWMFWRFLITMFSWFFRRFFLTRFRIWLMRLLFTRMFFRIAVVFLFFWVCISYFFTVTLFLWTLFVFFAIFMITIILITISYWSTRANPIDWFSISLEALSAFSSFAIPIFAKIAHGLASSVFIHIRMICTFKTFATISAPSFTIWVAPS